jgi:hypothetical protein
MRALYQDADDQGDFEDLIPASTDDSISATSTATLNAAHLKYSR